MSKKASPWASDALLDTSDLISLGNFTYLQALKTAAPALPHQTASATTPTVSEFLNGAISEYVLGGTPDGMRPFLVDGHQMTLHNSLNGATAHTWITAENQLLISYAGTTRGENLLIDPLSTAGGLLSDLQILSQQVSSAQRQSLDFAHQVIEAAAKQGYGTQDIFVTGHSLGGISAEYVAQQTGLGGISFEASGIPRDAQAAGHGSNFVNVVTLGDPVANYSSDIHGEQPFAPTFVSQAEGGGSLPHYGSLFLIGAQADQHDLAQAAAKVGHLFTGDNGGQVNPLDAALHPVSVTAGLAEAARLIAEFHLPAAEYTNLGVTPTGGFLDTLPAHIGTAHGPVLMVGNYSVAELQAFAETHATFG
ncbi:hypothetical protein [Pseudomonas sp. EpS/L25]|uniref:hypothetical protein n=1 Tax=Pseudomonas sp. EpS/L25 TaxID=1749078 RepID=UPI00074324CF|nr:hypothetical protein [Pseudomonas sp. EpS/L25]KUM34052.1 hypothetical protein AR540_15065 [Pseudomonas sp. EpS/L25]